MKTEISTKSKIVLVVIGVLFLLMRDYSKKHIESII